MSLTETFDLTGRIAVVTGADVVCADIDQDAADQARVAVAARGRCALAH